MDGGQWSRRRLLQVGSIGITMGMAGCETASTGSGSQTTTTTGEPTGPFEQTTKLAPTDGGKRDRFGAADIALNGDGTTALAAAIYETHPNGQAAGVAYVFQRVDGQWRQESKLYPVDGDEGDLLGQSVGLSDDGRTAVLGASNDEHPNGDDAGSAYVFRREEGVWYQAAKLAADDGDGGDAFGAVVSIDGSGETIAVGAGGDEDPNGEMAGSAYVFEHLNGEWRQRTKLAADDGDANDSFGRVALSGSGDTLLVGARNDEDPNGSDTEQSRGAGAAYVFERTDDGWHQQAKIAPDDGDPGDGFGLGSLSQAGDRALITASTDEDPNGENGSKIGSGSAYVFEQDGDEWAQVAKLAADDGDPGDFFGSRGRLSDDGTLALIGASGDEDPNGAGTGRASSAGSAYVFERVDGEWRQRTKLAAEDGDPGDRFGWSAALAGDGSTALVGAINDEDPNGEDGGSVYVFER